MRIVICKRGGVSPMGWMYAGGMETRKPANDGKNKTAQEVRRLSET
jgi:hypothetical protein